MHNDELVLRWLTERFDFNPDTGRWLAKPGPRDSRLGDEAGASAARGNEKNGNPKKRRWRIKCTVDGRRLYAQRARINFLYAWGYLPETVDHIDEDTLNDSIYNLRPMTNAGNIKVWWTAERREEQRALPRASDGTFCSRG